MFLSTVVVLRRCRSCLPRGRSRRAHYESSFLENPANTDKLVGIKLVWVIRIVWIAWIIIWESEPDGKSEADEDRIRPKKTTIGKEAIIRKEAAINEETIIREKAAVKIIKSAVEKSTTSNEAWTVKLVKSATLKTHIS